MLLNRKIIFYLLLVSLLAHLSCGNLINDADLAENDGAGNISIPGEIKFTRMERAFSMSGDIRIEEAEEQGYYIAGSVADASGETTDNVWFSLIDHNGDFKSEAVLKSEFDDRVRRVRVLDSENLIIYADRYYADGDVDFIITKVNRKSGIVWDYCFGDERKNRIFDVEDAYDGSTLITGLTYYRSLLGVMHYVTFLMKIDKSGKKIWEQSYRSLFSIFIPYEIKRTVSGEYLFSGVCLNRITSKFKTFFARVDVSGNVLSSMYINAIGVHSMLIGTSVDTDGGFTGVISLNGSDDSDSIVVASFDNELNIQSLREYSLPGFNIRGKLIQGVNGDIIVAGLLNNDAGNGLYFLRFTEDGLLKELSTKYYDEDFYDLSEVFFNLKECDEGILYLCRYSNSTYDFTEGRMFLDKFSFNNSRALSRSKDPASLNAERAYYETGEMPLSSDETSFEEKGGAGLLFSIN